ncbi:MAG: glycerate kinase [Clostridia bacterium]|nr:glycerate kinase [Clostridia bacterium]
MKAVIAIDSFKGSLSTFQSGEAVSNAIKRVFPDAKTEICPIADGGEGTVSAITSSTGGELVRLSVTGPLGRTVAAEYGFIEQTKTAVIEMSSASGITLISPEERNPLYTTTYGVGEIISDAISRGARRFIVGIGGSATNDGGVGMLSALGYKFLTSDGTPIQSGAIGLRELKKIDCTSALAELSKCSFFVACDVTNPLSGENGCSAVYGPQKGANELMIREMDAWLTEYARLTKEIIPTSDESEPGAGAAGGLGFALSAYLGAKLTSGIDLVIGEVGLEEKIRNADVVVTGEGRLDGQSCMGKAPVGVARIAKKYGKLTIAFSGAVTEDASRVNAHGIDAFFPILRGPATLGEAMDITNAYNNLSATAEQVFRLIKSAIS